jgi:hypothetical protein
MTEIKQKKAEDLQQLKKHSARRYEPSAELSELHLPKRPRLTEKEARKIKKYLRQKLGE